MEMNGQLHAPITLPLGKNSPVTTVSHSRETGHGGQENLLPMLEIEFHSADLSPFSLLTDGIFD